MITVSASALACASAPARPDEALEHALLEIRESVAAEVLDAILNASPRFFENLVLDLLHAMGYGTSRTDLLRVGGVGDEGIDGIISLDRLGLEKVYVQAKRWQNSVGRPDVQAFYGALRGQRANKGVFITIRYSRAGCRLRKIDRRSCARRWLATGCAHD